MKKIILLFIIVGINYSTIYAQINKTKKADRLYERLEFVKAAEEYLSLIKENPGDYYITKRLAECYYNIFDTKNAEKWYKNIVDKEDSDVIYKYAQMLKANGKYAESNLWMNKFSEKKPYDSRAIAFKNTPNYIDKIIDKGKKFNIQNLSINSEFSDFGSTIYNNELYFVSARNEDRKSYGWNNEPFLDIYSSFINDKGSFLEPLLYEDFSSKFHEGIIAFSKDGNTAYFTRESYFEKEFQKNEINKTKYSQLYIFKATRLNDKWISFEALPFNDSNYSNKNPVLDEKGEYLYFSSNMPGGYGLYDIYRVKINDDGTFSEPENLGQKINTEGQEAFPSLENNFLYFSSDGHLGLGGLDVFYSKNIDNKWSNVRNVGIPVNSAADDFSFVIKGETGYVSSNRSGGIGNDDIYALKKLKPICDILFEIEVVDAVSKKPIDLALTSVSDETGIINNSKSTNSNGKAEYIFECEDEFKLVIAKEDYDSKIVDVKLLDVDPPTLVVALDPIEKLIIDDTIELNPIYFDFDKFNITNKAAFELDKLVEILKKYPQMVVKAESHTDSRGNAEYNRSLSEKRAKSTVQYVISKGIDENRISGVGMGEDDPEIDCSAGCSKDDHAKNRRSEFIIISR
ncbi:MAG: cell envelope biogenesis protein OmpA [Flavobacteriaceae bacterium]|nr:cell envelope biogenesis protein OmpA [Flavobacteriaceae bacterium]|tara:strand:+ start:1708 stop:3591 length:1884 start_codon:yes stop_codon:yes gene_type:complete